MAANIDAGREEMVKVLIERKTKKANYPKLMGCLRDLRAVALRQPGYVTGETLVRMDGDSADVLVISTWVSEAHWKAWSTDQARIEINDLANSLLEGVATRAVWGVPSEWEE